MKALDQDSKQADAINGLGNIFLNRGLVLEDQYPQEALKAYNLALEQKEEAIKVNSRLWYVWYDKSLVLKALHRDAEAEEAFAKAKELGYKG
jgi:tetratricopeptide (TPR) repeat protein